MIRKHIRSIGELRLSLEKNESGIGIQKLSGFFRKDNIETGEVESVHEASLLFQGKMQTGETCECQGFMSHGKCRHISTMKKILDILDENSAEIMGTLNNKVRVN